MHHVNLNTACMTENANPFLAKTGGYRNLLSYRIAVIVHDLTVIFVKTRIPPKSRTTDQMVQAARSGKQNICEGSAASMTSKETEIKLTNVAKASLEELLIDYEDYIRQHSLQLWSKSHPRYEPMRQYVKSDRFMKNPMEYVNRWNDEEFCNICITLINQTTYLLGRLIERQQQMFLQTGGIREQMSRARRAYRDRQYTQPTTPPCPPTPPTPTRPTCPTSPTGPTCPTVPTPSEQNPKSR